MCTNHFEDVGDLGHVIGGESFKERHTAQELEVVVDALQASFLHHLLEDSTIQCPYFGTRYGY